MKLSESTIKTTVKVLNERKEKSTAAHRSGLKHIIVPFLNKKDLEDIPDKVKKDLKISFVKEVEEVIKLAVGI